jgi:GntR family transcriptional regulator
MAHLISRPKEHRFLHEYVADELRKRILSGEYPPGSGIPSRRILAAEFRVSDITVRRAIRDLTFEGILSSHQGLGSIVKDQTKLVRFLTSVFSPDKLVQPGHVQTIKPISLTLVSSTEPGARKLKERRDSVVYRYERVILANGEPFSHELAFFAKTLGDKVKNRLSTEFLTNLILEGGAKPKRRDILIEGGVTNKEESIRLNVPVGSPVLISSYDWYGADERVLMSGRSVSRADKLTYFFSMGFTEASPQNRASLR